MRGERVRDDKRPEDPEGDEGGISLRSTDRAGGWRLGRFLSGLRRSGWTNGLGGC